MGSNPTFVASWNVLWLLHMKRAAQEQNGCDWSGTWAVKLAKGVLVGLALTRLGGGFFMEQTFLQITSSVLPLKPPDK